MWTKARVVGLLGALLFAAGVAWAAGTQWRFYQTDLVRCADVAAADNDVCGSATTGTDSLSRGTIIATKKVITLVLRGAAPSKEYRLGFLPIENSGSNPFGSYNAPRCIELGTFSTDRKGNASAKFDPKLTNTEVSSGPKFGYFMVASEPDCFGGQFISGFDFGLGNSPSPTPTPTVTPASNCSGYINDLQPVVVDNFNGYSDGSIVGQDGWVSYVNGDHFVVQGSTAFEGAKAVHNDSFGDSVAGRYGTSRTDGKQAVCFRTENRDNWGFYSADGNVGFRVSDGLNGTIFASVSLKKDGHVAYYDPIADVYSDFATYNDNEWALLEIEWRSSGKTARYRINGGTWTDWKTFRGAPSFTKFDFLHFGFVLPSGSGGVYFDALR